MLRAAVADSSPPSYRAPCAWKCASTGGRILVLAAGCNPKNRKRKKKASRPSRALLHQRQERLFAVGGLTSIMSCVITRKACCADQIYALLLAGIGRVAFGDGCGDQPSWALGGKLWQWLGAAWAKLGLFLAFSVRVSCFLRCAVRRKRHVLFLVLSLLVSFTLCSLFFAFYLAPASDKSDNIPASLFLRAVTSLGPSLRRRDSLLPPQDSLDPVFCIAPRPRGIASGIRTCFRGYVGISAFLFGVRICGQAPCFFGCGVRAALGPSFGQYRVGKDSNPSR